MQFDFQLAPGASQTIDVKGRFFKYKAGTGLIRVRTSLGGFVDVLPGQGIENVNFTSLTIADRSNAANVGSILAGDFDFRDDRISGSVEVIDGGRTRTLAGAAFLGGNNQVAVGGVVSNVQIWNPPASSKIVVVKEVSFSGDIGGLHSIKSGNSVATTVSGNGTSKRIGGSVSAAQLCIQTGVLPAMAYLYSVQGSPNQNYTKVFQEPVVLMPGFGLFVTSTNLGENLFTNFEWVEEPV